MLRNGGTGQAIGICWCGGRNRAEGTRLCSNLLLYLRHGFVPDSHKDVEITQWRGPLLSLHVYQGLE